MRCSLLNPQFTPNLRLFVRSLPIAKQASRNTVVDLQSGDPACREVWALLCDISRKEFQKVYDRLGVTLEEHGESFYNEMIPSTIDKLAAADLVSRDDGADIVRLEHFTYPLIVRKRDGEYTRQLLLLSFSEGVAPSCGNSFPHNFAAVNAPVCATSMRHFEKLIAGRLETTARKRDCTGSLETGMT